MPSPAAPMASEAMATRVRSRAWSCITGSSPSCSEWTLAAMLLMRGVAEALSVKLAATT